MELFHVQRFYGNDDEFGLKKDPEKEKQRLEELKDKIKKKESERLLQKFDSEHNVTQKIDKIANSEEMTMDVVGSKKKRKKKKNCDIDLENSQLCVSELGKSCQLADSEEGSAEVIPKKKRKKKSIGNEGDNAVKVEGEKLLGNSENGNDSVSDKDELQKPVDTKCLSTKEVLNNNNNVSFEDDKLDVSDTEDGKDGVDTTINLDSNNKPQSTEESSLYYPILGSLKKKNKKASVKRMLPKWIAQPKEIFSKKNGEDIKVEDCTYLKEFSKKNLQLLNVNHLFPVQSNVIPYVLSQACAGSIFGKAGLQPSDICVSAPTGSGKTLAYVLPIVQVLHHCLYRRLQALVVLPSKDLALQVKTVFSKLVAGTHLKIGLAAGIKSFRDEQQLLVTAGQNGHVSNVDILVSTPGRLVDHITSTEGFSLKHIRFLVIDEADRLLGQSYHNWLEKVFESVFLASSCDSPKSALSEERYGKGHPTASTIDRNELPLQKLLFSATMTQNPEKLGPLNLYNPIFFKVMGKAGEEESFQEGEVDAERYTLPELLEEKIAICKPGEKPILVAYFVKVLHYKRILCFTGSIEATHRLCLLLKAFDIKTAEFSSTLNQTQRKGILRDFKAGKIDLLVCSDAMSRGMDIEDVDFVISYDPPVNMKTYVHRVGRTARAGNAGTALTLLSSKEVFHFKKMAMGSSRKSSVKKLIVPKSDLEPLMTDYENALASLKDVVKTENKVKH